MFCREALGFEENALEDLEEPMDLADGRRDDLRLGPFDGHGLGRIRGGQLAREIIGDGGRGVEFGGQRRGDAALGHAVDETGAAELIERGEAEVEADLMIEHESITTAVFADEDDAFLEYLAPSVARYDTDPAAIAKKLIAALTGLAQTGRVRISHDRLMPRYIPGDSVGAPADRG